VSWGYFLGGVLTAIGLDRLQRWLLRGWRLRQTEKKHLHWIESPQITRKEEHIEMPDGVFLQGYEYSSDLTLEIAPSVIFFHGFGGFAQDFSFEPFLSSLCLAGFRVFAYDYRASGKSRQPNQHSIFKSLTPEFVHKIYQDPHSIVDWVYNHAGVDKNRINLMGASMGGSMVLGSIMYDARVKKIIGVCAPYDFGQVFSDKAMHGSLFGRYLFKQMTRNFATAEKFLEIFQSLSPCNQFRPESPQHRKVYLAHCQNDEVIDFSKNFILNVKKLGIPPERTMIFTKGGHEFRGMATPLISRVIAWLSD
jgi:pimeloyl-ACP methyl ester carboxylesterase